MASYMLPYVKNPPCTKDCPDRQLHCHSQCDKYIKWREEHLKLKQKIDKHNRDERNYISLKVERKYCERKRKGK